MHGLCIEVKARQGNGWERVALFKYQYFQNQTLTRELVAGEDLIFVSSIRWSWGWYRRTYLIVRADKIATTSGPNEWCARGSSGVAENGRRTPSPASVALAGDRS